MPTALVGRYWYSYINEGIVDNITILYTIIFCKYGIMGFCKKRMGFSEMKSREACNY